MQENKVKINSFSVNRKYRNTIICNSIKICDIRLKHVNSFMNSLIFITLFDLIIFTKILENIFFKISSSIFFESSYEFSSDNFNLIK